MVWPTKNENTKNEDKLRLKDGDNKLVKFLQEEPEEYVTHWDNATKKTIKCTNDGNCIGCANQLKKASKYNIKVLNITDSKEEVLNGTWSLFAAIRASIENLRIAGQDPFMFNYMLTRTGEDKSTKYSATPIPVNNYSEPALKEEEVPF